LKAFVSRQKFFIRWTRLTAVALASIGPALHADTPPPSAPANDSQNYKNVQLNAGGKSLTVRVKQQPDPLKHATFTDELDPHRAFSATNDMANKSFSTSTGLAWNKAADLKPQDAFAAKPYSFNDAAPTAPNLNTKATFRTTSFTGTSASGLDKPFPTTEANLGPNQTAVLGATTTSPDQNRTAALNGQTVPMFASFMADKTFQGTEADAAHQHLKRLGNGQIEVSDLPNRTLTIDEVRDLLNHGFKPNTAAPPPEASKPLNDPDYQPQPLRDDPSPTSSAPRARPADDDKDDPVPPPGTMAPPPDTSEPLPQR
jgi:hypothetical protein